MPDASPAESIFFAALGRPPADRAAFLDGACGGDAGLRARIERMLAAQPDLGEFLGQPAVTPLLGSASPPRPPGETTGTVLAGKYELAEPVGEGGMGAVWLARQTEPVRRAVAVKLIKAGMDSRQVLARFEAERQALALMDHPNIAKVHDAGATPDGRPFFVMEYVKGVPITDFCDARRLTPRERLELFVPVCQAIQHAHQKGVIHRDIKPSNVLVATYDDRPVPKVIDFGVPVAAAGLVLLALVAGVVGTTYGLIRADARRVEAEQARGREAEQRVLAEDRLAKLETGVEILGAVFADIDPRAEKLGGDPVPVAIGKRLARAADRLTGDAVGDALVVARLQGILGRSLGGVGQYAKAAEVLETAAATRAAWLGDGHVETLLLRLGAAAAYRVLGKQEEAVRRYEAALPALARQLPAAAPDVLVARGQYASALTAVGRAKEAVPLAAALVADYRAAGRAEDQDALEARNILAHAHLTAGDAGQAITLLDALVPDCKRILGKDHPDTLAPQNNLAMAYHMASRFADALAVQRDTYAALYAKHRHNHESTLVAWLNLGQAAMDAGEYSEAVTAFGGLLKVREDRHGPADRSTLTVRGRLGVAHLRAGHSGEAIKALEQAADGFRPEDDGPEAVTVRNNLAMAYTAVGQPARAVPLLEAVYAALGKRPGQNPADLIVCRSNLGSALAQTGQFDRAARLHETSLAEAEEKLGPHRLATLQALNHLGLTYRYLGRTGEAIARLQAATDRATLAFGAANANTLVYRLNLLGARREAGEVAAARAGLVALVGPAEKAFGPAHPTTLAVVQGLAEALELERDWTPALAARARVVDAERRRGVPGPALPTALVRHAQTLLAAGRPAEAEPLLREALAARERAEADLWGTFFARAMLGAALAGQGKYAEAEPLLLEGYRGLQTRAALIPYGTPLPLPWCREHLVRLYEAWGKPDEVARWRAEQTTHPPVAPPPRAKVPPEK